MYYLTFENWLLDDIENIYSSNSSNLFLHRMTKTLTSISSFVKSDDDDNDQ